MFPIDLVAPLRKRGQFLQTAIGFIELSRTSETLGAWLRALARISTVRNAMGLHGC
jgi:hypothetical protein